MSWIDRWLPARASVPSRAPSPDVPRSLALYETRTCGYCLRVRRSIERLGLTVESRDLNADPAHRAHLRSVTGRTTVPCLFIDDTPLFESADIVAWLEAYAEANGPSPA